MHQDDSGLVICLVRFLRLSEGHAQQAGQGWFESEAEERRLRPTSSRFSRVRDAALGLLFPAGCVVTPVHIPDAKRRARAGA